MKGPRTMAEAAKAGIFAIYKPGQGKWVRWGTVAGLAIVAGAGAYWLGAHALAGIDLSRGGDPNNSRTLEMLVRFGGVVLWLLYSPFGSK